MIHDHIAMDAHGEISYFKIGAWCGTQHQLNVVCIRYCWTPEHELSQTQATRPTLDENAANPHRCGTSAPSSQAKQSSVQATSSPSGGLAPMVTQSLQIYIPLTRWLEQSPHESPWAYIDTQLRNSFRESEKDDDATAPTKSRLWEWLDVSKVNLRKWIRRSGCNSGVVQLGIHEWSVEQN